MVVAVIFGSHGYWGKNVTKTVESLGIDFWTIDPAHEEADFPHWASIPEEKQKLVTHVFIVTPTSSHLKIANMVYQANPAVKVYIEKPVVPCKELVDKLQPSVFCPHIMTKDQLLQTAWQHICDQKDQLEKINVSRLGWGIVRNDTDVVHDLMLHDIAVLCTWFHDAKSIEVDTVAYQKKDSTATFDFDDTKVQCRASWQSRARTRLYEFYFKDGSSYILDLTKGPHDCFTHYGKDGSSKHIDLGVPDQQPLTALVEDFLSDNWSWEQTVPFARMIIELCDTITTKGTKEEQAVEMFSLDHIVEENRTNYHYEWEQVLNEKQFTLGSYCAEVEQLIHPQCTLVSNGTVAITIMLQALDLPPGSEVIIPNFTFIATATGVIHAGLTPVFADVCPDDYLLDPESVAHLITSKTKVIMGVSLFGHPWDPIDIKKHLIDLDRNDIVLLEDGCQGYGADKSKHVKAWCTSFYPSKPLSCLGEGGAICVEDLQDQRYNEQVKQLRNHGMDTERYNYEMIGYNAKMPNFSVAALKVNAKTFPKHLQERREIAERYLNEIKCSKITLPSTSDSSVWAQFTIVCDTEETRDALKKVVTSRVYYPQALSQVPMLQQYKAEANNSEWLAKRVLSLPCYPGMPRQDITKIIEQLNGF